MIRLIFNFAVGKPGRLTAAGSAIGHTGFFFTWAGLFSRFPGMVGTILFGEELRTLSELFPQLPLWWLPESVLGLCFSAATLIAGVYLWALGRRVDRLYQST